MTAALEAWVEKDLPPAKIVAIKYNAADVVRTRPLCPYPQVARYFGKGSTDEAANFKCVEGK